MTLHLTKVAVGCASLAALARRQAERAASDGTAFALTRHRPTRAAELAGGSLFWIVRHRLVARQAIAGFDRVETDAGSKCRIALAPVPVPVVATPCRAHQGWRYLAAADAPRDLAGGTLAADGDLAFDGDLAAMPAAMVRELAALWLV